MERIVIDAGRRRLGAGVRHEAAARASRCASLCPRGGTFRIQIFIQPSSPEIGVNYFWSGRLLVRNGVACFWATSFRKKRQQLS